MTRSVKELQMFMSDMHWTKEELIAQFYWVMCVGDKLMAEANEAEYETYLEVYYSDYEAEMLRESMWITNHC
jgi:hypothetical protein